MKRRRRRGRCSPMNMGTEVGELVCGVVELERLPFSAQLVRKSLTWLASLSVALAFCLAFEVQFMRKNNPNINIRARSWRLGRARWAVVHRFGAVGVLQNAYWSTSVTSFRSRVFLC